MDTKTLDMLADIQRLALAGSAQTGRRIYHNVQAWPDGEVWSEIGAVQEVQGGVVHPHRSAVVIRQSGNQEALYSNGAIHSLAEQRDALASWIVASRKREDAA